MKRWLILLVFAPALLACSVSTPNFYRMSESELEAYNAALPPIQQVSCVTVKASPAQESNRVCGTLAEIESNLVPEVSAQQRQNQPAFQNIHQSRSTNPALRPPAANGPFNPPTPSSTPRRQN